MRQGFEKVKTPSPANFNKITRAKAYWNNVMSLKAKKELLSVKIKDLKVDVDENKSTRQRPVDVTTATKLVEDWSRNESEDKDESQDLKLKPWPYCNNINRNNLINKIQSILGVLIQSECFAWSHLYMLKGLTLEMLKNRIPKMLLKYCLINMTLVSMLFLDEPKLERVLAFLTEELETSCILRSLHTSIMKDRLRGDPKIIRKGIVLSDDLSRLIQLFNESKSSG
nr:hypothetical protein CFP56_46558 [Quercus suber]